MDTHRRIIMGPQYSYYVPIKNVQNLIYTMDVDNTYIRAEAVNLLCTHCTQQNA